MNIAKVFQSGSDQAIRLPDEFRVDVDEVYLKRTPEGFLVMPRDPWDVFFEDVEELSNGFFRGPMLAAHALSIQATGLGILALGGLAR